MLKQRIEYSSPLDALIAVTKRLSLYENRQHMTSAEFFDRYNRGELSDDREMIEWAIDYRQFLGLRQEVESQLQETRSLEALALEALESGPATPMTQDDWDYIRRTLHENHRQRKADRP